MGNRSSSSQPQLDDKPCCVIVGGGYGGTEVASRLDPHCNVILIDKKNHFLNNMGALRPVAQLDKVHTIAVPYDRLLTNGAFIQGTVTSITDKQVTLAGIDAKISFDYVVIATGSSYAFPMKHQLAYAKDLPKKYEECHNDVKNAETIVIVGGGPVGIELLGEIATIFPNKKITLIHGGDKILPADGIKDELRQSILTRIKDTFKNCAVVTGERIEITDDMKNEMANANSGNKSYLVGTRDIETNKGRKFKADLIFFAFGTKLNNSAFKDFFTDAINPENGRLKVQGTMQVEGYKNVFALLSNCFFFLQCILALHLCFLLSILLFIFWLVFFSNWCFFVFVFCSFSGDCADGAPLMAANAMKQMGSSPALAHNIIQLVNGKTAAKNIKQWHARMFCFRYFLWIQTAIVLHPFFFFWIDFCFILIGPV